MLPDNPRNYLSILEGLKQKIRQARVKAILSVNAQLIQVYWEIGKVILEQQEHEGWGAKIIDKLAADLKVEFPDETGFSVRNLKYMRSFAEAYPTLSFMQGPLVALKGDKNQTDTALQGNLAKIVQPTVAQSDERQSHTFVQSVVAQIPWTHHTIILDKAKDLPERIFYIQKTLEGGWSKNILKLQIESDLYKRQGNTLNNFAVTLPSPESDLVNETFKSPYLFDFLTLAEDAKEKDVERGLVQHLKKFMLELGRGFAYVGNQYNLKVENDEYFLDLLFYNINLHCYVIFELKIGDFKPEFAGKLNFYINTVDEEIKGNDDKPTIGILLCKTPNRTEVKYALKGISTPLGIAEYELTNALPTQLESEMPTIEELEAEIEKEYEELKSPTQKRLERLKEKLAGLNKGEIKQTATPDILFGIIDQSVVPLYKTLISRMADFEELFYSSHYSFQGNGKEITDIEQLAANWKDENFLRSKFEFYFTFWLRGFKKAGTEAFDTGCQITFKIDTYSYGFVILNHNNQQPFIKKLYHEQLTPAEIELIVDTVHNKVMDDMDRQIEYLKDKEI